MLCAKNLKVALAAILGVVGLVGAGTAHAAINLNPPPGDDTSTGIQYFAAEQVFASASTTNSSAGIVAMATTSAGVSGYMVTVPRIPAGFEAQTYYVRFDLLNEAGQNGAASDLDSGNDVLGMGFNPAVLVGTAPLIGNSIATTTAAEASLLDRLTPTTNEAVIYSVTTPEITAGTGNVEWALPANAIVFRSLASFDAEVTFKLRMSIWNGRGDARRADVTGRGSQAAIWISSSEDIVGTKKTLSTSVRDPKTITTTVTSGFRAFATNNLPASSTTGETMHDTGRMATARVEFDDGSATAPILNLGNADRIAVGDVLERVNVMVTGSNGVNSYNFGEFYIGGSCEGATGGMARVPTMGAGTSTADVIASTMNVTGALQSDGDAVFCVNVADNTADQDPEVYQRIEPVTYTMALETKLVGVADAMDSTGDQPAGGIRRDGTTVRIAYLTTATDFRGRDLSDMARYNQRLTIVNHGSRPAMYTLGDFSPEEGVTVQALDAAVGTVDGNMTHVIRVTDLIEITGGSRTAAILTLVGTPSDISVATTQVTRPEGQTDTVRWHPLTER